MRFASEGVVEVPSSVAAAVAAAREKQASEVRVLDLRPVSSFTDYFVILTGSSQRQVHALVDAIVTRLKQEGVAVTHIEGYSHGEWVLIDCSDLVVHVFSQNTRSVYDLERLWSDAKVIDIPEVAA